MKKLLITSVLILSLQTYVFASAYSSININKYNLAPTVANSYIRGVIAQGNVTRWNSAYFPLKVYIQTQHVPEEYVVQIKRAYADWQKITDGQISFTFVNSPYEADTKCIFKNDIPNTSDDTVGVHMFKYMGNKIADSTISFRYTDNYGQLFMPQQFYIIALHEIGHSLGLAGHSSNSADLMYPVSNDRNVGFSQRDLTTLKLLYKIIPDNTNIPLSESQKKGLYTKAQVVGGEDRLKQDAETAAQINKNITPEDPNTRLRLAMAYQENGNYQSAISEYKAAVEMVEIPSIKSSIYYQIAECYIALKNYTAARNCAKFANTNYPSEQTAILPAKISYANGQKQMAVKQLLGLWNNNKNQHAGALLKTIYEESINSDKVIKELIEREIRF